MYTYILPPRAASLAGAEKAAREKGCYEIIERRAREKAITLIISAFLVCRLCSILPEPGGKKCQNLSVENESGHD